MRACPTCLDFVASLPSTLGGALALDITVGQYGYARMS